MTDTSERRAEQIRQLIRINPPVMPRIVTVAAAMVVVTLAAGWLAVILAIIGYMARKSWIG